MPRIIGMGVVVKISADIIPGSVIDGAKKVGAGHIPTVHDQIHGFDIFVFGGRIEVSGIIESDDRIESTVAALRDQIAQVSGVGCHRPGGIR